LWGFPEASGMNKHKVEQRRLVFKGREFHFVSYEGQVANAARAIEATEASWFLMSAGKRWEVMPHSPDQEALEVDKRLMAWLKERMAS
jgi:hypothetical protein